MTFRSKDYTPPSATKIREARKALKLTQAESAEAAGVSRRSWIRYESGDVPMPRPVLTAFCQAYRLDLETMKPLS